jgi:hypothetical protein
VVAASITNLPWNCKDISFDHACFLSQLIRTSAMDKASHFDVLVYELWSVCYDECTRIGYSMAWLQYEDNYYKWTGTQRQIASTMCNIEWPVKSYNALPSCVKRQIRTCLNEAILAIRNSKISHRCLDVSA